MSSDGISVNGFDDMLKVFEDLEFTDRECKTVVNEAGGNLALKLKNYIKSNVYRVGGTLKGVKGRLTTYRGESSYKISIKNADILYIEYGSAKVTEYIGFFENFIDDNMSQLLQDIESEINKIIDKKV